MPLLTSAELHFLTEPSWSQDTPDPSEQPFALSREQEHTLSLVENWRGCAPLAADHISSCFYCYLLPCTRTAAVLSQEKLPELSRLPLGNSGSQVSVGKIKRQEAIAALNTLCERTAIIIIFLFIKAGSF